MGSNVEISAAQLLIAGSNQYADNILDRQRGDATFIGASYLLGDTTDQGRGIGRFAVGIGAGALLWEGITLMPVFGQVNWHPFVRRAPWASVHLSRLGIAMRFGGILGAWKPTTRGQLAGHTYTDLAFKYPAHLGRFNLSLDAGLGMILLRGPYTIAEEGLVEDRRFAEFIYPRLGLSVGF
ncbi:MAG: hypothetical protein JNN32_02120 [Flavobacteriales bacterium]|nr:hypothetical protein [Flavobacteriales bacterium]